MQNHREPVLYFNTFIRSFQYKLLVKAFYSFSREKYFYLITNNMSLTSLDLRNNRLSRESEALDRIAMVVRKNELDSRK